MGFMFKVILLLARGRDRLETIFLHIMVVTTVYLLLARGRDRLETSSMKPSTRDVTLSYSLGDAIDWKR